MAVTHAKIISFSQSRMKWLSKKKDETSKYEIHFAYIFNDYLHCLRAFEISFWLVLTNDRQIYSLFISRKYWKNDLWLKRMMRKMNIIYIFCSSIFFSLPKTFSFSLENDLKIMRIFFIRNDFSFWKVANYACEIDEHKRNMTVNGIK